MDGIPANGGGDFLGTGDLWGTYYYDYINETASDGETVTLYAVLNGDTKNRNDVLLFIVR